MFLSRVNPGFAKAIGFPDSYPPSKPEENRPGARLSRLAGIREQQAHLGLNPLQPVRDIRRPQAHVMPVQDIGLGRGVIEVSPHSGKSLSIYPSFRAKSSARGW